MKKTAYAIYFLLLLLINVFSQTKALAGVNGFPSTEYRVGLYQDFVLDEGRITHIIISGSAVYEDSDQFFQSSLTRAQRYKEVFPDHQVVIISSPDVLNTPDEEVFRTYNVIVAKKVLTKLNAKALIGELKNYSKIASIDFFGHSSPWSIIVGSPNGSLAVDDHFEELRGLRPRMQPNAYVTLNACNTGYFTAPALSAALKVPVAGALTSSMFERIGADGFWYKEDDWIKGNYTEINKTAFTQKFICATGMCNRMKPSRFNYSAIWGKFKEGGLSFSKFFCNFNNADKRCEKGMAMSIYTFPSLLPITLQSPLDDYKKVLFDWLCSTSNDRNYIKQCSDGILASVERYDLVYRGHPANELMCDFKSCHAKVLCDKDADGTPKFGTCHLKTPYNPEPTNLSREYLSFLQGFELLKKELK